MSEHNWLNDDEIVGEIEHRTTAWTVVVTKLAHEHGTTYEIQADRRYFEGDYALNMGTAAAGMSPSSSIELGGDRKKRVTFTKTEAGAEYAYVEVGNRD